MRHGFTLIELIVTISIIAGLMVLALPIIATMNNYSRVEAGVNTVGVAAQAARAYVDRERTYATDPISRVGQFRGVAIIFAPSGEVRIAVYDDDATLETAHDGNAAGTLLHLMTTYDAALDARVPDPRYAFRDIPNRDYISIPDRVLIQGVIRDSNTGEPVLLDPPFAIRYDENGHLVVGDDSGATDANDRHVFYDGDHSGDITVTADRPTGYAAAVPAYDDTETYQRHYLPFEKLEAVAAVRITDTQTGDYQYITFSPYTGSPMRAK